MFSIFVASHADVLRGSSRVPAPAFVGPVVKSTIIRSGKSGERNGPIHNKLEHSLNNVISNAVSSVESRNGSFNVEASKYKIILYFDASTLKLPFLLSTEDTALNASGLQITAGQRTMSGQNWVLTGQILGLPDILSGPLPTRSEKF